MYPTSPKSGPIWPFRTLVFGVMFVLFCSAIPFRALTIWPNPLWSAIKQYFTEINVINFALRRKITNHERISFVRRFVRCCLSCWFVRSSMSLTLFLFIVCVFSLHCLFFFASVSGLYMGLIFVVCVSLQLSSGQFYLFFYITVWFSYVLIYNIFFFRSSGCFCPFSYCVCIRFHLYSTRISSVC